MEPTHTTLKIPYCAQSTPYWCGPASLHMMFAFHSVFRSEAELAVRLRTNRDTGTRHDDMVRVAREEGFFVYTNVESSLKEVHALLNMELPVAVHFVEPTDEEAHYSVAVGVGHTHVMLNDPWNGERVTMDIEDFTDRWSSEQGSHEQWVMALGRAPFTPR